jgi:hypothetical protein
VLAAGPLLVWLGWHVGQFLRQPNLRRKVVASLTLAGGAALLVSSPWWALKLRAILAYYLDPASPHRNFWLDKLGPAVTLDTVTRYFGLVIEQLGWPAVIFVVVGVCWGVARAIRLPFSRSSHMGLWLLLTAGLGGLISVIALNHIATRFITPVLVPWGVLAGLAASKLLLAPRLIVRALVMLGLAAHVIVWWHQCISGIVPIQWGLLPANSSMRPIDIEPLPAVLQETAGFVASAQPETVWTVGNNWRFNSLLANAIITERGYRWQTKPLYEWFETADLSVILRRLTEKEWIMVYESVADRPDLFTSLVAADPTQRFDKDLLQWLIGNPDQAVLVAQYESVAANNRYYLFRIGQD